MTTTNIRQSVRNDHDLASSICEGLQNGSETRPVKDVGGIVAEMIGRLTEAGVPVPPMIASVKRDRLIGLTTRIAQITDAWLADTAKTKVVEPEPAPAPVQEPTPEPTQEAATAPQAPVGAHGVTVRKIGNAVGKLPRERRLELYAQHIGGEPPSKATVKVVVREIATALAALDTLPEDVSSKVWVKPSKKDGPATPKRIDTILSCLRKKGGSSINEIADALMAEFPEVTKRWGGGTADREQYKRFTRVAISHLRAGRTFAVAKDNALTIERTDDGRFYIVS